MARLFSLLAAIITARLTVRWSLKRFYSERWWERKADAYSRIMRALFWMKRYADDWVAHYEQQTENTPEREKELGDLYSQGALEVEEATALGAFVISDAAARELENLRAELRRARHNDDLYDTALIEGKALDKCISEMRVIASFDLGVKRAVIVTQDASTSSHV